jgi:hypothetical protein
MYRTNLSAKRKHTANAQKLPRDLIPYSTCCPDFSYTVWMASRNVDWTELVHEHFHPLVTSPVESRTFLFHRSNACSVPELLHIVRDWAWRKVKDYTKPITFSQSGERPTKGNEVESATLRIRRSTRVPICVYIILDELVAVLFNSQSNHQFHSTRHIPSIGGPRIII